MMNRTGCVRRALLLAAVVMAGLGCTGPKGDPGIQGTAGPQGPVGPAGPAGDPLAAVIPLDQYDITTHAMTTTNVSVAQALCIARHGIWDSGTNKCGNPLAYGTAAVPRTDSDGAAVASCPSGFTPADCATAFFLLQFWRLNPNSESANGHAWCSGTMDPALNTGKGLVGSPGYWYAAGATAPDACASGSALVIDQLSGAEFQSSYGRPSYPRPHLYCAGTTQNTRWMCVSTSLP